jgi:hypothetical protein
MLKAKVAAATMLPARVAGVSKTVGGAAIRSCHAADELPRCLRASVGVGSMGCGGEREFCFFCFILCGEGKMLVELVVLVNTCQHGEVGDPEEKSPGVILILPQNRTDENMLFFRINVNAHMMSPISKYKI